MHSTSTLLGVGVLLGLASNAPFLLGFPREHFLNWILVTIAAIIFFVLVPFYIIKRVYLKPLSEYGFRLPVITKRGYLVISLATAATLVQIPLILMSEKIRIFYTLPEQPLFITLLFIGPLALIYYLCEEFLFRGFLTFAVYRNIGLYSIAVIAILFGILHIGKPIEEMLWAMGFSALFSWVSIETKSFLPAALLHFLLAFTVSIIVNLYSPGGGAATLRF